MSLRHYLPLAGAICAMVSAYGGRRIRFDLEDGSGGGLAGAGPSTEAATPTPAPSAATEAPSIRESLAQALRQQEEGGAAGEAAATSTEAGQGDQIAAPATDGRPRNPDGTFAPKPGEQQAAKPNDAEAATDKPAGDQQGKPPATGSAIASMTPQEREAFGKLPADLQGFVQRREAERTADYQRKTEELANERRFYGELAPGMQVIDQFSRHFKAHPVQLIQAWAQVQDGLLRDPKAAILGLAKQFNVDLTGAAASPAEEVWVDPAIKALEERLTAKLTPMEQMLAARQQAEQAEQQRSQQAAQAQVQASVEAFQAATDENGQPKYPHFTSLRQDMAALMRAGMAETLEDAYERAMWSRPDLREQLLAAQREQAQRQQQEQRRAEAARARGAAVSVTGAPGGASPPAAVGDTSIRGLLARGAGYAA